MAGKQQFFEDGLAWALEGGCVKRRKSKMSTDFRTSGEHAAEWEANFDPGYSTQLEKVEFISHYIFTG